ncbi:MAG: DUF2510 domain-containing protein, partial [Buchananella hordeovulneris]|nr:DUF2510 domain-containing protein [Buchananella hordeovulneris]
FAVQPTEHPVAPQAAQQADSPAVQQAAPAAQQAAPAPNWYLDPANPNLLRYWDGQAWTNQTHPRP